MSRRGRWGVVLVALAALLAVTAGAGAVAPEVKDTGKFFSEDAIKKANDQIREIARKYDRDLLVETYESVPSGDVDKVKNMSKDEVNTYFRKWAEDRAQARVVNGAYVLICKEPKYLYVEITPKAKN